MIAAYVRVSSKAQDYRTQEHAIAEAARRRGDEIADWRCEKVSGAAAVRPELLRLRDDARAGRVRRLYVYALDRLSRGGIRDMLEVVEFLRSHGVEIVSVADPFDLGGPQAELVIAVWAWLAKQERQKINERIARARERVEAEGGAWGRPSRITTADRQAVARMRQEGRSVRAIAQALGIKRATVGRIVAQTKGAAA